MEKFICIFPVGENIHLIKDVGMIPYFMQKDGHYDAYISFYKPEEELSYLKSDLKGLKYVQIENFFKYELLNVFFFLIKNLFKYDVVMLFHPTAYKVLMTNIIKLLSFNKVKFYFKMDFDSRSIDQVLYTGGLGSRIKKSLCRNIDLFSAESQFSCNQLNKRSYYHAVKYIPNGCVISETLPKAIVKDKIFLTVGRLGTYEKGTETLLEAFGLSGQHTNWRLVLVGTVEGSFEEYMSAYFQKYPWASDKIDFLGVINDRMKLNAIYKKSAVFVLPSRYESFGLVLLEAMAQGCFILSTALPATKDILGDAQLGRIFPIEGKEYLAELMQEIMADNISLPDPRIVQEYVNKKYSWSVVVRKIANYLNHQGIGEHKGY